MSREPIRIEIVAPVHNRRELTLQCLRSLSRIDSAGLDVHIVIVDDGSTDATSDAIREQFPSVELVQGDGSLWFTEGTNVGIRAALKHHPNYVLLINDDSVFDPKFLSYMIETAETNPRSVVGPLLLLWDQPHKVFQTSPVWDTWRGGWRHWYKQTVWTVPQKAWKVDLIVGNCVLVPAAAINEVGLMDSRRFPNFGDAEYTPRLKKQGWELLIDPRSRVFCQPNTTPARIRKLDIRQKAGALFLDAKNIHNLRRRFYAYWYGAPTKPAGVLAFVTFLARMALRNSSENEAWVESQPETPLAKRFAAATMKD
jgi:GT2 family glycosyltransferase